MKPAQKPTPGRGTAAHELGFAPTGDSDAPPPYLHGPPSNDELGRATWFIEKKVDAVHREIFGREDYEGMRSMLNRLHATRLTAWERILYAIGALGVLGMFVLQLLRL